MLNFLSNSFSFKDIMNIIDNMQYFEINMYMQATDLSYINLLDNYRIIHNILDEMDEHNKNCPKFFLKDEIFDKYAINFTISEEKIKNYNITNFFNSNEKLFKKLKMMNLHPIIYNNNNTLSDLNFTKYNNFIKKCSLFLNIFQKIKLLGTETDFKNKTIKYFDKILINYPHERSYFYLNNRFEIFHFNPFLENKKIAEKYIDKAQNIKNSKSFCNLNNGNLIKISIDFPLYLDREDIEEIDLKHSNPTESNNYAKYNPELIVIHNNYDEKKLKKNFNFSLINKFDENYRENIKDIYLNYTTKNIFIFSNLDYLDNLANQIFSTSDYSIIPIFTKTKNFNELKILNKDYCYIYKKIILNNFHSQSVNENNMKNFVLEDCFLDKNKQVWIEYLKKSINLLNLNSSTSFKFCEYDQFNNEKNFFRLNETFRSVPLNFCLNRFSLKKRLDFMENEKLVKSFKFKNTIMPLLSYDQKFVNLSISNFYLGVYFKNEGKYINFENFLYEKIMINLFKGIYIFFATSMILIIYFIYNIIVVKDFVYQPLEKIETTLSNISDKIKFKDSKKYLDEYLLEEDSRTINEFKLLIKIILKLVEGNLNIKKNNNKNKDLEIVHIYKELHPINMVKFNRFIVFENKILESFDKNQYCIKLTDKSSIDMEKDEKLMNSSIFSDIIQKKFFGDKDNKIDKNNNSLTNIFSEEKFRCKYQNLGFEFFKSKKDGFKIDDIFKCDWTKLDDFIDSFFLEVKEKYMENWYRDDEKNKILFDCYEEIFDEI